MFICRRVRLAIIEDSPIVRSTLERVFTLSPGYVVSHVVHRNADNARRVGARRQAIDTAKGNEVLVGRASVGESLSNQP